MGGGREPGKRGRERDGKERERQIAMYNEGIRAERCTAVRRGKTGEEKRERETKGDERVNEWEARTKGRQEQRD